MGATKGWLPQRADLPSPNGSGGGGLLWKPRIQRVYMLTINAVIDILSIQYT